MIGLLRLTGVRRTILMAVVSALILAGLVVFASTSDGYSGAEVALTDSSVWVTNNSQGLVGRVNRQIDELNSAVKANRPFDVLQQYDSVLVVDGLAHELRPVDTGTVTLGAKIGLPAAPSVGFGGGDIGIADTATGKVWAGTADALAGLDPSSAAPLVTTAPHAVLTVSVSGTVFVAAAGSAKLWTVELGADGNPEVASKDQAGKVIPLVPTTLPGPALSAQPTGRPSPISITAVGEVPVVLDSQAGVVVTGGVRIPIPGAASAVLQQPGPAADSVLIATSTALLRVPLRGGVVDTLSDQGSGTPAAPVLLDGCVHAAWAGGSPVYVHACGADTPTAVPVPIRNSTSSLVFRVNRDVIVLNDQATGDVYLVDQEMKVIDNWDQVQPESQQTDDPGNNGNTSTSTELTSSRVDCKTQAAQKPAPAADSYGVRAGRTTVLRVLDNDASADCSMVTISAVGALPRADGTVVVVDNGQALQITVPAGVSGPLPPFDYTVDDGDDHHAGAGVSIDVVPAAENPAPVSVRGSATEVEINGIVSYNVVSDFRSPAGDDLFLVGASVKTDDSVTYQPDGLITFRDLGTSGAVKKEINFTVSDGHNETDGTLTVQVLADGTGKPTAAPVYAHAMVGAGSISDPLLSVTSPGVDPLRLVQVAPKSGATGATATVDSASGTVSLKGTVAGSYYFTYDVAAGDATATGVIRFDVTIPPLKPLPPVAMADVGYLVQGHTLVVDPLANDVDPLGGVLSIQQLNNPAGSPLTATVRDLHLVQISSSRTVPVGGTALKYTVTNGVGSAVGEIRVVPVPAPTIPQAPVAGDVDITVRAGDAVSIPMADHAADPGGEALTVEPVPAAAALPGTEGLFFTTPTEIRYLAPKTPPGATVKFKYTVVNTDQLTDSGTVTVTVTAGDPAVDSAPRTPAPTVARVFQNQQVTIGLPLDGIDPDGDWVTYNGLADPAPATGRVNAAGPESVLYSAIGATGLDSFGYQATDPYGKQSIGQVTVAVVPRPSVAEPPVAPDLKVTVRPGRGVSVDLLGAASDPGGNIPFTFSSPAYVLPPGITASLVKNLLVVRAPATEGVFPVQYTVLNSKKLAASGILQVTVSKTAALDPPSASDVFVDQSMVGTDKTTASFDLSGRLTNPSGQVADLTVTLDPIAGSAAAVSGRKMTVPLTNARQVLAYRVTDLDGGVAQAFVVVPPKTALVPTPQAKNQPQPVAPVAPPSLRPSVTPFTINAGQTKTVNVPDYVSVGSGRSLQLPSGAPVSATAGTVSRLSATTLQYSVPDSASGEASIRVTVTDGSTKAVALEIPVIIIPKVLPPPVFSSASMQVEKGKSAHQDLSGLVATADDAQRAALRFTGPSGLSDGLSGSVSGSTLNVSAPTSAKTGSGAVATVTVTDGKNTVTGQVTVTVVGSTAPRITLNQLAPVQVAAGQPVTLDVLAGAFNPFPGTPLTITSAAANNGAPAMISGSSLQVTPPSGKLTQFTVTFTVGDATGDTSRRVTGTVTVIPLAKPTAPTQVVATSLGKPDQISLSWHDPALVRPDITAHTVYSGGGKQACGTDTTCTVKGLTPGKAYTFKVSATNSEGEGPPSLASNAITPDVQPGQPQPPTVAWAAPGALDVSWTAPSHQGSPITRYVVTSSDGTSHVVTGGTSYRWTGLDQGTAYTFTVNAVNQTGQKSLLSAASQSVVPVGPTPAPSRPTLAPGPAGGSRSIVADWNAPSPIYPDKYDDRYTISASANGAPVTCAAADTHATSCVISGVTDGVDYTVTVAYVNIAGSSPTATSDKLATTPDRADVTAAGGTGTSKQISVTVAPQSSAGGPITSYHIYLDGDTGSPQTIAGTTGTITVPANGASHLIYATACVADGACGAAGQWGTHRSAYAYGSFAAPTPRSSVSGNTVTFSWDTPDGNGRPISSATYNISSGESGSAAAAGSWSKDIGYSSSRSITVTVCVTGPSKCDTSTKVTSATTPTSPPPTTPPPAGQPETSDTNGSTGKGAPTYPSYNDVSGDGSPYLPKGTTVQVKCYQNAHTIGSDGGRWYRISSGAAAGRWSPSNNFVQGTGAGLPAC